MTYLTSTPCSQFYVPPLSPVDLEPLNSTDRPLSPHSSDDFHSSTNFTTAGNIPTFHVTRTTSNEAATGLSSDLDTFLLQPIPQNSTSEPQPISSEKKITTTDETGFSQPMGPISIGLTKKRHNFAKLSEDDYEKIKKIIEESKTLTIAASRLHIRYSKLKIILSEKFPRLLEKFYRTRQDASEQQIEQIRQFYSLGYNAYQISVMTNIKLHVCKYQIEQIRKNTLRTLASPSNIPHFSSSPITTENTTTYHDTRTIPNVTATGLSSDLDAFLLQPIPQNSTSEPQPISSEKETPTTDETRFPQPTGPISIGLTQKRHDFSKFSEEDYEKIKKIIEESETLSEAESKLHMARHRLKLLLSEKFPRLLEKFYRTRQDASEQQIKQIRQFYSLGYNAYQISVMTNIKMGVCVHQIAQIEKNKHRTLAPPSDIPNFSSTPITTENTTTYHDTRTIPNITATGLSSDLDTFLLQPIPQDPTFEPQSSSSEKETPTTDETRFSQPTGPISIGLTQKRHDFSKFSEDDYKKIRTTTEESETLKEAASRLHMWTRTLKRILSEKFPHLLEKFYRTRQDASEQQIEQIRQFYSLGYNAYQISVMTNIKIGVCVHQIAQIEKHKHRTLAPPSGIPNFSSTPITTENTTTYHDTRTTSHEAATGLSSDLDTFLLQPIPQDPTFEPQSSSSEKETPTTDETRFSQPTGPISIGLTQKKHNFSKFSKDDYEKIIEESKTLKEAASRLHITHSNLKMILLEKFPHLLKKFRQIFQDVSEQQIEQIRQLYSRGYNAS